MHYDIQEMYVKTKKIENEAALHNQSMHQLITFLNTKHGFSTCDMPCFAAANAMFQHCHDGSYVL